MTVKEKKIIIEAEQKLWCELQFEYWYESQKYAPTDFESVYEFQRIAGNSPEFVRLRHAWSVVNDLLIALGLESSYDEKSYEYQQATYNYFKK